MCFHSLQFKCSDRVSYNFCNPRRPQLFFPTSVFFHMQQINVGLPVSCRLFFGKVALRWNLHILLVFALSLLTVMVKTFVHYIFDCLEHKGIKCILLASDSKGITDIGPTNRLSVILWCAACARNTSKQSIGPLTTMEFNALFQIIVSLNFVTSDLKASCLKSNLRQWK